jgi:AcrR family transcriptional regulator
MHSVSESGGKRLTRAQQQAQTRERVLEAADEVFARRGFHAARLEQIADQAGFTRGAVYSNFRGKDELALAIIEGRIRSVTALLDEIATASEATAADAEAAGLRFSELLAGDRDWGPLFLEFATHASRHPELAARMTELYRGLSDSIATVLVATTGRAGVQLPVAPERLALIVLALTDGASVERLIDPERADGQLMAEMFGWIAAGLLASPTSDDDER